MAEEKKSFMQEFMDFLNKYGVIGLAVAFVMGAAITKLVTALVNDLHWSSVKRNTYDRTRIARMTRIRADP